MHHLCHDITPTCDSKYRKNSYQGVTSLAFICLTDNFTVEKYLGHHFPEAAVSVFLFLVNIRAVPARVVFSLLTPRGRQNRKCYCETQQFPCGRRAGKF